MLGLHSCLLALVHPRTLASIRPSTKAGWGPRPGGTGGPSPASTLYWTRLYSINGAPGRLARSEMHAPCSYYCDGTIARARSPAGSGLGCPGPGLDGRPRASPAGSRMGRPGWVARAGSPDGQGAVGVIGKRRPFISKFSRAGFARASFARRLRPRASPASFARGLRPRVNG